MIQVQLLIHTIINYTLITWTAIPDITNWSPEIGNYDIKAVMNTITYNYQTDEGGFFDIRFVNHTGTINTNQTLIFENIEIALALGEEYNYTIKEGIEKVLSVAKEEIGTLQLL